MVTIADILPAAKKLGPNELDELRAAIDKLARRADHTIVVWDLDAI